MRGKEKVGWGTGWQVRSPLIICKREGVAGQLWRDYLRPFEEWITYSVSAISCSNKIRHCVTSKFS